MSLYPFSSYIVKPFQPTDDPRGEQARHDVLQVLDDAYPLPHHQRGAGEVAEPDEAIDRLAAHRELRHDVPQHHHRAIDQQLPRYHPERPRTDVVRYPVADETQHGVEGYQDHEEADELPVAEDVFLKQLRQRTERKGDKCCHIDVSSHILYHKLGTMTNIILNIAECANAEG